MVQRDPATEARDTLDILSPSWAGLDPEQQHNAYIIYKVLDGQQVPLRVIQAAVVNAIRESDLRADQVGDDGNSFGLFQTSLRGAGAGVDPAKLVDPVVNTSLIAREYRGPAGDSIRAALADGASGEEIAVLFMRDVERPSRRLDNADGSMGDDEFKTRIVAEDLFGTTSSPVIAAQYPVFRAPASRQVVIPAAAAASPASTTTASPAEPRESGLGLGAVLIGLGILTIGVGVVSMSGGR